MPEEMAAVPPRQLHTLVFSGGANHAAAFFGALAHLESVRSVKQIRRVVGSSAGALVALMTALGFKSDEMVACASQLAAGGINKVDMRGAFDICDTFGLDAGHNLRAGIRATVARGLPTRGPNATFKELAQARGIDLIVCVLNVSRARFEYMSLEASPDMPVALAVQMSMSLPILFAPVRYGGCLYADPVLGRNFPWDFPGAPAHWDEGVLGLALDEESESDRDDQNETLHGYVTALLNIALCQANAQRDCSFPVVALTVRGVPKLEADDEGVIKFAWDPEAVTRLVEQGRQQTRAALDHKTDDEQPPQAPQQLPVL